MADRNVTAEEVLLDVKVADASKLYKFFLITGMVLTEILNRMESRFDKRRPNIGAAA
jgi:hypothetical protein